VSAIVFSPASFACASAYSTLSRSRYFCSIASPPSFASKDSRWRFSSSARVAAVSAAEICAGAVASMLAAFSGEGSVSIARSSLRKRAGSTKP